MDAQTFTCNICSQILDEPVECNNCKTNYCYKHIKYFKACPSCDKPFKYNQNQGLIKLLNNYKKTRANIIVKMDNTIYQCNLCGFEAKGELLCYHLAEDHKKELIEIFGKKKENINIKESTIEKPSILVDDSRRSIDEDSFNNNVNEYGSNPEQPDKKHLYIKSFSGKINCNSERSNLENYQNPLSNSLNFQMYYCKKNNGINCECCDDHKCRKGNCMCVNCMKYNLSKLNLHDFELINKAGLIAKLENGEYHCGIKFEVKIKDEIGNTRIIHKVCNNNDYCPECLILNKIKREYINFIYGL